MTIQHSHSVATLTPVEQRRFRLEEAAREILAVLGEDALREGLIETPRRFADWWLEFADYDPGRTDTTFETVSVDQLVVVRGLDVWTVCEHHLLPFRATIAVGYLAEGRVLGLSKFGRIAQQAAHRLQLQERLVQEIADEVEQITGSESVAVVAKGEHLCMTMRGIKMASEMITSVMRGRFRDTDLRAEFLGLVG